MNIQHFPQSSSSSAVLGRVPICYVSMPIVLLHGWGCDSRIWQPLIPCLSQWADVITIDLVYSDITADALCASIAQLLPEKSIVCGWSLGGMLAARIAAQYPEKVCGLLALSANAAFVAQAEWSEAMAPEVFEQFFTLVKSRFAQGLKRFLLLETHGDKQAKTQLQWLRSLFEYTKSDNKNLVAGLNLLSSINNVSIVPQVCCPASYLFGENDALVPVSAANLFNPLLHDQQETKVFSGRGHLLHFPVQELEVYIEAFLAKVNACLLERTRNG